MGRKTNLLNLLKFAEDIGYKNGSTLAGERRSAVRVKMAAEKWSSGPQKDAPRAAEKRSVVRMRPAVRVFETPSLIYQHNVYFRFPFVMQT